MSLDGRRPGPVAFLAPEPYPRTLMFLVPIVLLVVLLVIVLSANSMKKKGSMTESAYQTLVSVCSVAVTIAALVVLFLRIKG